MIRLQHRQITIGLLLGALGLSVGLYLAGLAATLRLGDAATKGFLLVPALPTPLYIAMALVLGVAVSITVLNAFLRRRESPEPVHRRQQEPTRAPWYVPVIMIVVIALVFIWLLRQGSPLQEWLQFWQNELSELRDSLASGTSLIQQVPSPVAGYALFVFVIVIYGGIALLGLWVFFDTQRRLPSAPEEEETPQARRVRRAVTAGLRALQQHDDPRQAIIACYAQLEHLLADHGVPADDTLTPQEYMGAALRGVDVPLDAFAGLVQLFELARYSLHPLDEAAKQTAMTHLEAIKSHLQCEADLANRR